jgi:hypothetical protein
MGSLSGSRGELFVSRQLEEQARTRAQEADTGHRHHATSGELSWGQGLTSARAWSVLASLLKHQRHEVEAFRTALA